MNNTENNQIKMDDMSMNLLSYDYRYRTLCAEKNERRKSMDKLSIKMEAIRTKLNEKLGAIGRLSNYYVETHKKIWLNSIYKSITGKCTAEEYLSKLNRLKQLEAAVESDKAKLESAKKVLKGLRLNYEHYRVEQHDWLDIAVPIFRKAMIMDIRIEMNTSGYSFCSTDQKYQSGFYPTTGSIKSRGFKHTMFMLSHIPEYMHLTKECNAALVKWRNINSNKSADPGVATKLNQAEKNATAIEQSIKSNTLAIKELYAWITQNKAYYEVVKGGREAFLSIPLANLPKSSEFETLIIEKFEEILKGSDFAREYKDKLMDLCNSNPDYKDVKKYFDSMYEKQKGSLSPDDKKLFDEYADLEKIEADINSQILAVKSDFIAEINGYSAEIKNAINSNPLKLFTVGLGESLVSDPETAVEKVLEMASERVTLSSICSMVTLLDSEKQLPVSLPWQRKEHKAPTNLFVETSGSHDKIENSLNNLLVTLLASYPAGKAKFTFVDLQMQGGAGDIFRRLPNSISQVVLSENDLRKKVASLKDMVSRVSIHTNNIVEFNENAGSITHPYEFVIWRNYTGANRDLLHEADIMPLIKNGYRYGIYFIIVPQENADVDWSVLGEHILPIHPSEQDHQDFAGRFVNVLVNRLVENSKNKKVDSVRWSGLSKALQTPPVEIPENGMVIPVGEYPDGEVACYEFNDRFHHSLIIGTSGSGKSYLLHNIILNSMLKYDARYLEFYLMDFKFGGGEFKSYEGMPHVSHLLSDGLDKSVVLEVMRELERKMIERGKMIEQYKKLSVYNAHHPENPLPHIVLVVDEASLLFQIANNKEVKLQNEINRILGYIATQGRSQGVTFCFATQTFAGADIPANILRNITNRFLLKCESADADRLIERNGTSINESLTQGYTYMSASQKIARVFDYNYVDGGVNMLNKYRDAICSANSRPAGRNNFVYNGKASRAYSTVDMEFIKSKRHPSLLLGSGVTVKQEPVLLSFRKDMGENLLITGVNGEMQSERVFFNAVMSMCEWAAASNKRVNVICFDNYNDDENDIRYEQLNSIRNVNFVSVLNGRSRDNMIVELGRKIRNNSIGDEIYILALLGHERYRRNMANPLPQETPQANTVAPAANSGRSRYMPVEESRSPLNMINIGSVASSPMSSVKSDSSNVEEELIFILNYGPENGVHTIMHVDRPSSITPVSDKWSRREIQRTFKYVVALNLNSSEVSKLPAMEDISIETLTADNERLRAVYYDDENNKTLLFTPFDFNKNFGV